MILFEFHKIILHPEVQTSKHYAQEDIKSWLWKQWKQKKSSTPIKFHCTFLSKVMEKIQKPKSQLINIFQEPRIYQFFFPYS